MSTVLPSKTPVINQYKKAGLYLFSFLCLTTICIYLVVHILLYENADFQFDELFDLLKMIGAELAITACFMVLIFIAEWLFSKLSAQTSKQFVLK